MKPSISREALCKLLASVDDDAGHHVLWWHQQTGFHLDCLKPGESIADFQRPGLVCRFPSFCGANGEVGRAAAADEAHVDRLMRRIAIDPWIWVTSSSGQPNT